MANIGIGMTLNLAFSIWYSYRNEFRVSVAVWFIGLLGYVWNTSDNQLCVYIPSILCLTFVPFLLVYDGTFIKHKDKPRRK